MAISCKDCTYWTIRRDTGGNVMLGQDRHRWCTVHPPQITPDGETRFPITAAWMCCGSWQNKDVS